MTLFVTLPPNTTLASLSRLFKEPRHPSCNFYFRIHNRSERCLA
jgi:hypothetical protein